MQSRYNFIWLCRGFVILNEKSGKCFTLHGYNSGFPKEQDFFLANFANMVSFVLSILRFQNEFGRENVTMQGIWLQWEKNYVYFLYKKSQRKK